MIQTSHHHEHAPSGRHYGPSAPHRIIRPPEPRILLVDDELDIRESVSLMLSMHYEVISAEKITDVLDTLVRDSVPLDIAIFDKDMNPDGFESLRLFRAAGYRTVPVILNTNNKKAGVDYTSFGFAAVMPHKYRPTEYHTFIQEVLAQERRQAA